MSDNKVKVKFKIDDELDLTATMVEVYPKKKFKGSLFDFNKGFVVVETTINRLYKGNLKRLEKQAINKYIDFLKIDTKDRWEQADNKRRASACMSYNWLNAEMSGEQLIAAVYQDSRTLYVTYLTLLDIWCYIVIDEGA